MRPEGSADRLDRGLSFPPLLGAEEAGEHGSPSTALPSRLRLPQDDLWDLGAGWAEGLGPEKLRGGQQSAQRQGGGAVLLQVQAAAFPTAWHLWPESFVTELR